MAGMPPTQGMLDDAARAFGQIRDGFMEWYFETHPVRASELGVHQHDTRLPQLDRAGIRDRTSDLLGWLADLEDIRFDLMREDDRYDYAVLEYGIRAELLELEESREWANDPRIYTNSIARGLASVAMWEYAPLTDRLGALESRMVGARSLLEAARTNVRNPPQLWTELAIADARALVAYLEGDLMAMLGAQGADTLMAEVGDLRTRLVTDLESHADWLESDLLPRSTGNFRLGRYLFQRKLMYDQHVSLSVEELQRLNDEAIAEYRQQVEETARAIDPARSAAEVMDSINGVRPAPDELLATAREQTARARDWVVSSGVVMVPRDELPTVRDSPPYARDLFTSLDTPGPFEGQVLGAYYNVTNVRGDWDAELVREHMSNFSYAGLMATTLYETFPGKYVQRQYARDLTSVRRIFVPGSFSGGWAEYAAEMALDEGMSDDPALRLGQLQQALQRHARWDAVLRLHTTDEPLDRVVSRFMEIAYFDEFPARREVVRATRDPMYMTDALGRIQIKQLRGDYEEYLAEREEAFSLPEFHQKLLRLGVPFPLAREALMPQEEAGGPR
jgi:uncharacterized protein (DUF885 family)